MGMTLAEKILSRHADRKVTAGEIVLARTDLVFSHDANRPQAPDIFRRLGGQKLFDPQRVFQAFHQYPPPGETTTVVHKKIREFCREQGCVSIEGEGLCHNVLTEKGHVLPGELVVGADSHTCTYGALGAFSSGVGSTDAAVAMMTGKIWLVAPETLRILITGKLPPGVYAKDIMLYLLSQLKADGATYQALEFAGPVIDALSMDGRFTMCNMATEMGAKAAFFAPDQTTFDWLKGRYTREFTAEYPDQDAHYVNVLEYDVSNLSPYVAVPHNVDTGVPVGEVAGMPIQLAFHATCTAGHIEDLRISASILKDRKIAPGVRLTVVPTSREVLKQALAEGLVSTFVDAGAIVGTPSCAGCAGSTTAYPTDGDVVLSTGPRNFKGRLGNPKAFIYLASPATVAASAVEGKIADPRAYLG